MSLAIAQKLNLPWESTLELSTAADQVVHLESAENLIVTWRQANDFSQFFFLFLSWKE